MKRKQKPMRITQLDTLRGVRKPMPRPTVRQESSNKGKQKFTTKQGLDEWDEELEDLMLSAWYDEFDEGDW